jgi:hypothetical protein
MEQAPSNWARGPATGRPQPDGASHVDQDQNCRSCVGRACLHGRPCFHPTQAHAGGGGLGWGIGAGLIGAAVVGTAIAANSGPYYGGYRRCAFVRQFDVYGNYIGTIRSCNYY